ncbi:MAG: hypothetical protein JNG85_09975, partial [Spirochaetaceae bacterium]|nr:hypothetical protein [Spirochaetaceae bacterium]
MKKPIAVALLGLTLVAGAFAQLLPSLADDFEALMASVGRSAAPHLFQAAISSDIVGEAAFRGGFPHGSFTLLGLGADTGKGLAEALTDGSYAWKFALPMPSLLQTALGASTYQTISKVFPYPGLSLGLGFGLTRNLEVLANGIFLPSGLAGLVPTLNSMDPSLSAVGVSAKLRYVLFRDGPRRPAISIALGGAYSSFAFGVRNFDLASLAGGPVEVSSGTFLNLAGRLAVDAKAYGGGLEFHVS